MPYFILNALTIQQQTDALF